MGHLLRVCNSISRYSDDDLIRWKVSKDEIEAWTKLKTGKVSHDIEEQQKVIGGHRPGGIDDDYDDESVELEGFNNNMMLENQGSFLEQTDISNEDYDWVNDGDEGQLNGMDIGLSDSSDDSDEDAPPDPLADGENLQEEN